VGLRPCRREKKSLGNDAAIRVRMKAEQGDVNAAREHRE
jgi:hypothetical protein